MALLPGVSFQWHTPRGLLPGASSQGALPNYILNGTNHDENMSFECERDAQCTFYNDYKRFWTKKHNLRCNCFENTHFGTKNTTSDANASKMHILNKKTQLSMQMLRKCTFLNKKTQISMQMLRWALTTEYWDAPGAPAPHCRPSAGPNAFCCWPSPGPH